GPGVPGRPGPGRAWRGPAPQARAGGSARWGRPPALPRQGPRNGAQGARRAPPPAGARAAGTPELLRAMPAPFPRAAGRRGGGPPRAPASPAHGAKGRRAAPAEASRPILLFAAPAALLLPGREDRAVPPRARRGLPRSGGAPG